VWGPKEAIDERGSSSSGVEAGRGELQVVPGLIADRGSTLTLHFSQSSTAFTDIEKMPRWGIIWEPDGWGRRALS
jgi:hypothetical protein